MLENERDTFSNDCVTKATQLVKEAKQLLLANKLNECIAADYDGIYMAMRGVLALDDVFPADDYGVEREFRGRYIEGGMTSDELSETLDKLTELHDIIITHPEHVTAKPEAGFCTSKANFFIMEITDYIVSRNALFWGQ